jgi:hypothetical protein
MGFKCPHAEGLIEKERPLPSSSFYIIVALPVDGHNYWPKHVIVNVINSEFKIIYGVVLIR